MGLSSVGIIIDAIGVERTIKGLIEVLETPVTPEQAVAYGWTEDYVMEGFKELAEDLRGDLRSFRLRMND